MSQSPDQRFTPFNWVFSNYRKMNLYYIILYFCRKLFQIPFGGWR